MASEDVLVPPDRVPRKKAPLVAGGLVTVGRLDVKPNSRAVVPGEVTLIVDIRDPDDDSPRVPQPPIETAEAAFANTTIGQTRVGARLNIEVDVLAKHVEKLLAGGRLG